MPLTIWKFPLKPGEPVMMPAVRQMLSAAGQGDDICVWAEVNPATPLRPYHFAVHPTGAELPEHPGKFLGTAMLHGGSLVFHVYELRH